MSLAALVLLCATGAAPDNPQAVEKEDGDVTMLLEQIHGKENRPAGEVFRNVQLMKDVPAARFLKLMDTGFSRALGVGCDHCHVEERWEADDKRPKRAAREMIQLVNEINDHLEKMKEIDNSDPSVTCTTCHRGYVKPATQMR
jgi:hypothetical protein